ncbi:MAG: DUF1343 domain-containing protein [Flavobacterium sp.]|nr:DUF1343 domain-containing protein [Flavobacterium sp.]
MISQMFLKNTLLLFVLLAGACGNSAKSNHGAQQGEPVATQIAQIKTGADNHSAYLPKLTGKSVGVLTNQTGVVAVSESGKTKNISIVDFLLTRKVAVKKIFAPEHGFRGTADAGELVVDGKDSMTGLPIISLYGDNKKPTPEMLKDVDVVIFDLQDVGARFYTYISSLHYLMEACAENGIEVIVLDRPNPNGDFVDGPILEKEHSSFVGMHQIPILHGMTIGEYAKMINGEKWLKNKVTCKLTVIPCLNYDKSMSYSLPIKPSPNLPNDQSVNLYASLCFFEGTNVSVGRGTNKQFQVYGSPFQPKSGFSFTPSPNEGAKNPPYNGQVCYGEDLSDHEKVRGVNLSWLIKAYKNTSDKSKFFNSFFTKLAGTKELQQQIVDGRSEDEIKKGWQDGIAKFKIIRKVYEIY